MTAKEYLGQINRLKIHIEQLKIEYNMIIEERGGRGVSYDEHIDSGGLSDTCFTNVSKQIEMEARIEDAMDRLIVKRHEIIQEIQQLEDERHVKILYKRYVEMKTFEQIATELSYDYHWTCKLHGYALKEFDKIIKNTNKHNFICATVVV